MTHLVMLMGLKTYINIDAQCWTAVPDNLKQLFMQQLRWRRSSFRSFFFTLRTFRRNIKILHPLTIINILIPNTLSIIRPIVYISLIFSPAFIDNKMFWLMFVFTIFIILGMLFNIYVRRFNPEQKINPFSPVFLCLWFSADIFLTLLALATFDTGEWGTRGVPAQDTQPASTDLTVER
jgi:cellulose synthase/poly-beta-1,6-N-acetylglucosamine synthase-like glycosyltransferase